MPATTARQPGIVPAWLCTPLAVLALTLSSCSDAAGPPRLFSACPCAAAAVCCTSGVCAATEDACPVATAALSSTVRGAWNGYIENFQWASDDSIRISIAVSEDGALSGWARIGQATPPAPAAHPTRPWPVALGAQEPPPAYIPGFDYSAQGVSWQALRLKFMIP